MRRLCSDRHKWVLSKGGSRSKAKGGGSATADTPSTNATQGAPSLPEGVTLDSENPDLKLYDYTTPEGNRLVFSVDEVDGVGDVIFEVNDSVNRETILGEKEAIRITSKVRSIMKYDASQRPDGFIYTTSPSTEDGLGAARASLYRRAGFSKAEYPGDTQYAIVRNGKLYPYNFED